MQASIFDIDGTLVESVKADGEIYAASIEAVLGSIRFRDGWEEYEFVTDGGILIEVLDDNSISHENALIDSIRREFLMRMEAHISEHGPFSEVPGAKDLLERLTHSRDHKIGIATGGWRAIAQLKLESAEFEISQIPLSTSDDAVARPDIMRAVLIKMGTDFDKITYYGDAIWDKQACQSLGWHFQAVGAHLDGIQSYYETTDA